MQNNEQIILDSMDEEFDDYALEDFRDYLNDENSEHAGFVIMGELDLWNGPHSIEPDFCEDLEDAYNKCLGRDTEDVTIYMEKTGEYIRLECHHHDGTNEFYIKALTPDACEMFNDYLDGIEDDIDLEFLNDPDSFETFNFF